MRCRPSRVRLRFLVKFFSNSNANPIIVAYWQETNGRGTSTFNSNKKVKKWRQDLRSQERELDKTVRGIDSEEVKTKRLIKAAAKRGDKASCALLSKEIIRARKAKDRIITSKATLNSLILSIQQQVATAKVANALGKSSEIMSLVNSLVKLPEISSSIQELSKEMVKAGIIEEMIQETIDFTDADDIEEAAQEEVDKVLYELTDGLFGESSIPQNTLPSNVKSHIFFKMIGERRGRNV